MKVKFFSILIIFVFSNLSYISAFGIKQTLKGLVNGSPLITTAVVTEVISKIEKDSRGIENIYTYVTVKVKSVLKGNTNNSYIRLKMFGGIVNGKGCWSEEWIPFTTNEEVLLFLHPKDIQKNIWELKSPSAKLLIVNNKGTRCFNCSDLFQDELSKNESYPLLDEKIIIENVKYYITFKKGDY